MGLKEDVLALAEELDGVSVKENCEACLASGTSLCRGDLECAESAHKACAKRLREIVEHDAGEVTTVSAYDLLPEDEREAIAWVREQGGLEAVKASVHQGAVEHGFLLKIAEMLGTSIYDGSDNADALLDKLRKRLMPDGMEWPKYTDGELVRIGGCWGEDGCDTSITYIERIIFAEDGVYLDNEYNEAFYRHGERVKRPTPKVLDADGAEIRVGDVLYRKSDGHMVEVAEVYEKTFTDADGYVRPGDGFTHRAPVFAADVRPLHEGETVYKVGGDGTAYVFDGMSDYVDGLAMLHHDGKPYVGTGLRAEQLTHERPVLDADGVPIREGDTVYVLGFGEPLTVKGFADDGRVLMSFHDENSLGYKPSKLTHERPDSWERLEHDAEKTVCEYFGANYDCANCPLEPASCDEEAKKDIIRRAKKLAERDE